MMRVALQGIGLLGPGLVDWDQGRTLLREPTAWSPLPTVVPAAARLPATERRRAGTMVRASVVVADQALAMAGADPVQLATVFASATGDPLNCHQLCEALATPERPVSPTRFTNSVHNAAAGYWHIATRSMRPSTSLAAFDASFGAGLLEAAVQCLCTREPVLLVVADMPYPEPQHALRPLPDCFALAFVLAPAAAAAPWTLVIGSAAAGAISGCEHAPLERLRQAIPAARALPLLRALALGQATAVALEAADGLAVQVDVQPRARP